MRGNTQFRQHDQLKQLYANTAGLAWLAIMFIFIAAPVTLRYLLDGTVTGLMEIFREYGRVSPMWAAFILAHWIATTRCRRAGLSRESRTVERIERRVAPDARVPFIPVQAVAPRTVEPLDIPFANSQVLGFAGFHLFGFLTLLTWYIFGLAVTPMGRIVAYIALSSFAVLTVLSLAFIGGLRPALMNGDSRSIHSATGTSSRASCAGSKSPAAKSSHSAIYSVMLFPSFQNLRALTAKLCSGPVPLL